MMKCPKLKTGLLFAAFYLVWAGIVLNIVADCNGMFCDLDALPVIVPFGVVVGYLVKVVDKIYFFGTSYTSFRLTDLAFTLPTVIGNMVFYYWIGVFAAWIHKKVMLKNRR